MVPLKLYEELLPQQHLFKNYEDLRGHIINIIHNRTTGQAAMVLQLDVEHCDHSQPPDEQEEGELYRLE
eukprot:12385089-Karenia_brevis.AAC.1